MSLLRLFVEPGAGAGGEGVAVPGDGLGRARFDGEPEPRRVAQNAPDADRVFGVARVRVADDADAAGREVFEAADVVDDRVGGDVVEEGVDGQVAAEGVLAGRAVCDGLDRGAAALAGAWGVRRARRVESGRPVPVLDGRILFGPGFRFAVPGFGGLFPVA